MSKSTIASHHFLNVIDWDRSTLFSFIHQALEFKKHRGVDSDLSRLRHQKVAMIFERPSLRTRISFEVAVQELGGVPLFIRGDEIGLSKRESLSDIAQVLSQYVDAVVIRIDAYEDLLELATYSTIPIINALTRYNHPCQALADMLTLYEEFGRLDGLNVTYVGRSNQDVARSLLFSAAKFGFCLTLSSPPDYALDAASVELACQISGNPDLVQWVADPLDAVRSADMIYTDVWVSVGKTDPVEAGHRGFVLAPYQVNEALVAHAPAHAVVMHCMPVNRGQEMTSTIADSPQSRLLRQSENRLHIQKAILVHLLCPPN